ncbi:MAG: FmdB family zinc ribbon protein [Opitutaceae bacterium]
MATYIYETLSTDAEKPRRRFEVQQSMKDAPLTRDPETGEPVRRVITGGYGFVGGSKGESASAAHSPAHGSGGCGHGSCGCGHGH